MKRYTLPQKVQVKKDELKTLNDFQKLLGDFNWLRSHLRITSGELKPLFDILKGDSDPTSSRELTPAGREALLKVEKAIEAQQIQYIDYSQPWTAYILATAHTPTAVLWQGGPLIWIHLPVSPARVLTPYYAAVAVLVQMCRTESRKYFGAEPRVIGVPFTKQQIDWLFQNDDNWAIAFANFMGDIDNHYPSNKLLQFANLHALVFPKIVRSSPLPNSETVFTDGSSNGTAAYVITGQKTIFHTPAASAQVVELRAVASVFDVMKDKRFNLYTDSQYIAKALPLLETVACIDTANNQVQELFAQVQRISWSNGIQQLKIWLPEGEQLSNPPKSPQSVPPCEKENEVNLYRVV